MVTLKLSGLREIHVPQQDSEVASNSVSSQESVHHIIRQNQKQFSQSRNTPLADTPLGRRMGKYGDTQGAEQLLSGSYESTGLPAKISRLLQSFTSDPKIQPYKQETTHTMFKEAFSKLSEKSPPLPQVGTLATIKQPEFEQITIVHCRMMTPPFQKGFSPDRWTQVINYMQEKAPGVPRIHRLRVIQIIEADLNQCLLLLFTRPIVRTAEKHKLLQPSQWSTRNQICTSAVLSKVINLEYSRICKIPTAWIEHDAKGCFDRIVLSLAVLNCRRYGAPEVRCKTLANIWNHLTHKIKWHMALAFPPTLHYQKIFMREQDKEAAWPHSYGTLLVHKYFLLLKKYPTE